MVEIVIKRQQDPAGRMAVLPDLVWQTDMDNGFGYADFELASDLEYKNRGGLAAYRPIETAIVIQLFSHARRSVDDEDFSGSGKRSGWFGNGFDVVIEDGEDEVGSLLWTLMRAPLTDDTGLLAIAYARRALNCLIRQEIIDHFDISYELDKDAGRINLAISAIGATGDNLYSGSYKVTGA
jgi:phage gp46-like protein